MARKAVATQEAGGSGPAARDGRARPRPWLLWRTGGQTLNELSTARAAPDARRLLLFVLLVVLLLLFVQPPTARNLRSLRLRAGRRRRRGDGVAPCDVCSAWSPPPLVVPACAGYGARSVCSHLLPVRRHCLGISCNSQCLTSHSATTVDARPTRRDTAILECTGADAHALSALSGVSLAVNDEAPRNAALYCFSQVCEVS